MKNGGQTLYFNNDYRIEPLRYINTLNFAITNFSHFQSDFLGAEFRMLLVWVVTVVVQL